MSKKKQLSTFDEFVADPYWRKRFEKKYTEFLFSEILQILMQQEALSVRTLAKRVAISPTVIQELKSGKRKNFTFKNFLKLTSALGLKVKLEKGKQSFYLL